ncbi:DEAD/DEAH box helicase [Cohnella luojiensis]|uniref:DEAD/DEAH box helicase n=2 Tax=Cohnella luojiensis TaxID=652876 RepID=A0A4Y8M3S7_9BACL|nr:DEAD/DEAH box helicase [Cohnella luojiensis]
MGRSRECGLLVIGVAGAGKDLPIPVPVYSSQPAPADTAQSLAANTSQPAPADTAQSLAANSSQPAPADTALSLAANTSQPAPVDTAQSFAANTNQPALADTAQSLAANTSQPAPTYSAKSLVTHITQHAPTYSAQSLTAYTSQRSQSFQPVTPNALAKRWGLSPAQSAAAAQALQFLNRPSFSRSGHTFLLWAVTGAGKTEMIFPLLESVLARGGRALVATPRRDVVLELAPRLAKAFPDSARTVLYGGSADRWENGALTLATTHQLLRFQEAFDLVLIDELDAFPYHNDPMLHYAADKCRKTTGTTVLLSATPPSTIQRAAIRRRLPCARVPVRYHRHPLPVPKRLVFPAVSDLLRKRKLPSKLLKALERSAKRGAQIFLFVPYVKQVEPLVMLLHRHAAKLGIDPIAIAGTSSKDADRTDKVVSFREHSIGLLVTTTILERGVTIPKSDVFILDSHNPMFDSASLVQMAGRAGRSASDPSGFVYYGGPAWTTSQKSSIRQIRDMNILAKRDGYLI